MSDNSNHPFVVRVISAFNSEFAEELNVFVNDIIQIENKLDKYWFYGFTNGFRGKIPIKNCQEIPIDDFDGDKYSLFAANNDFYNDCIDGDLRFKKGDLIIGLEPVDENWFNGCLYQMRESTGIFPLTHVWKLDSKLLPKKVNTNEQTFKVMFAKVLMDMKSQLENEMDLFNGEVIKITNNFDKMYFKGESLDGQRVGIIPKSFVKILEDYQSISEPTVLETFDNNFRDNLETNNNNFDENPPSYENVIQSSATAQPSSLGYSNSVIGEVESYGRALYTFRAEFPNELSIKENEIVHLIRHIDNEWIEGEIDGRIGIFPKNFIQIIVDCELNTMCADNNSNTITYEEFPADSFARVLYDFEGEVDGDLKVRKGDTLTLLRRIDNNWLEAMDDCGNCGFVALNYCEIIDDISSNVSTNISIITENSDETTSNPEIRFNEINEKKTAVNIKEFDPIRSPSNDNLSVIDENICNSSSISPKISPKIPRRPAPDIPKTPPKQSSKSPQEVSPHRAPPPIPQHRNQRHPRSIKSNDINDSQSAISSLSTNFIRQESIRSSITSTSSSSSVKSDTASGVTTTVPSAEDLRRAEERRKKVREQRGCVIMELLQTERDYKQNLMVCANIFLKNPIEARNNGIDVNLMFGNLEEIIQVSAHLIQLLEESTVCKNYENQRVGKCFLQIADDMKRAYSRYCKNHDEAQPLWHKYEAQSDSKQYLQKGLDQMREETNCFDIPSVLIKPVQRILKYPLLLNELYKCTEEGHEDRSDLMSATTLITDMATHINEFKRRQDLVHKYRKESSNSFSSRFSKLNLHTVIKKSSRLGHRISSTFGLTTITKDEEYSRLVTKFRTVEKTIKIFVKDKQLFMKSAQEFLNQGLTMIEAIAEYYATKNRQPEVDQLRTTHRVIVTQYWNEFNLAIDRDVTPVLNKLLAKFSGPNKLINKRNDKLLDFELNTKKLECNKDQLRLKSLQEQQHLAKNIYDALNSQLLEELPKLCDISMQILQDCIQAFLIARKQLIGRIAKHHLSLLDLPLVMGFTTASLADISETFHIKHNLIVNQLLDELSILPPHIFKTNTTGIKDSCSDDRINRKHLSRGSRRSLQLNNMSHSVVNTTFGTNNNNKRVSQSPSQRAYIQSRYQSFQLFQSQKSYDPCDILDIYLNNGDLVGVIKQQDPMGSKHRWFVDTGSAQGFVPSNILTPYHDDSWVTPPVTQMISKPPKEKNTMSANTTNITTTPMVQHQYKLHPAPAPPLPPRNDLEIHRYEDINEDSPPRYSRLDMSYANLLLFESENESKSNGSHESSHYNLEEFDPYAPNEIKSASPALSSTVNHRYEEIPDSSPIPALNETQTQHETREPQYELYFAAYPFTALDSHQLSLEFGQPVAVKHKCDLKGNTEWWFVQNRDGCEGFVPSNYLTKYQSK